MAETRVAKLSMIEEGIVQVIIDYKKNLTIVDAREIVSAAMKLSGGEKSAILMKSLNYRLPVREVRGFPAGAEATKLILALAFIAGDSVARIAANFFLKLNKPSYPFGVFTRDNEAIQWLRGYIN